MLIQHANQKRSGVVLLVVLALLSLFAIVGLSFVFYADAEAISSRAFAESLVSTRADVDPEVLAAFGLGQVLYDNNNPYSALRGHSLARSIYGFNPAALNFTPYNGVGRDALAASMTFPPAVPPAVPIPIPPVTTDNKFLPCYMKYERNINPENDPWLNALRTPEFFGKQGDPNYRYVGGANPPWTAYDINSMFLAEVAADGTVLMPSFVRPWTAKDALGNPIPANSPAARYASFRPNLAWNFDPNNPANNRIVNVGGVNVNTSFFTPDTDATGDVKNLDFGPGGNDSIWIDMGFPIMTAPDGKRYKPLFAPLIMDLSNRIHLLAAGNWMGGAAPNAGSHVSHDGMGAPEVNVAIRAPRVSSVILPPSVNAFPLNASGASEAGAIATIHTATPHGFQVGDQVIISGVRTAGYNGTFTILTVPANPSTPPPNSQPLTFTYRLNVKALGRSGYGTVTNTEFAQLFKLKYNGGTAPTTLPITFSSGGGRGGLLYSLMDFDAVGLRNPAGGEQGVSTRPMHFSFGTQLRTASLVGATTLNLVNTFGTSYGGFHWSIYPGMVLSIVDPVNPVNSESVNVTNVNYVANTITIAPAATRPHLIGSPIGFGINTKGTPYFPPGTDNVVTGAVNEVTGNAMGLVVTNNQVAGMEALLRYQHTNGPAITGDIFRLMPKTFSSLRTRNMYTTANWSLDRIGSSPSLWYDRTQAGHFTFDLGAKYPKHTNPLDFQPPPFATPGALANSDFTNENGIPPTPLPSGWRSTLSQQLRVDLNRRLADYPPLAANGQIPFGAAYNAALGDRQALARDIYNALVRATGARDPNVVPGMTPVQLEYQAARWLAQLAVNIVDYIDADDYSTPFRWFAGAATPADQWVFGTELPRLNLNEIYAQQETGLTGTINVWAEMFNPFSTTPATSAFPADGGAAVLAIPGALNQTQIPPYKIETYRSSAALTALLRDPANSKGDGIGSFVSQTNWGTSLQTTSVLPSIGPNGLPTPGATVLLRPIGPDTGVAATSGVSYDPLTGIVTVRAPAGGNFTGFTASQAVTITGVQTGGISDPRYEGTFNIQSVEPIAAPTWFKIILPPGNAPNPPFGGGGTATVVQNGNLGYYVIGPSNIPYSSQARNPQFPVTWASPQGMSLPVPSVPILPATADPLTTGATNDGIGNVVTIRTGTVLNGVPQAQVHPFQVGDTVLISNVTPNPAPGFNGTFTITSIAPPVNPTSFTYNIAKPMPVPPGSTAGGGTVTQVVPYVTVLLRRLANPRLPANNNPANVNYNPYITIDYVDSVSVMPPVGNAVDFATFGRTQPYAAVPTKMVRQATPPGALPNTPQNTFFRRNSTVDLPFEWLTHLDRPLINPLELLHVSGYKQHELTQQFINPVSGIIAPNGATQAAGNVVTITTIAPHGLVPPGVPLPQQVPVFVWGVALPGYNGSFTATVVSPTTFAYVAPTGNLAPSGGGTVSKTTSARNPFQHYAPWPDQTTLLYRALELFGTANHMAGTFNGGRHPGKININTLTEWEVLAAIFDSQDSNQPNPLIRTLKNPAAPTDPYIYDPTNPNVGPMLIDTKSLFNKLVASRNGVFPFIAPTPLAPSSDGKPFRPASAGNIGDTVFRPDTTPGGQPSLFSIGANNDHPYLRASQLQKIYNNITTTSNCFAVWMTVGFFEVVDESVKPARLGAEIGRAQNRHVRHRMFSIVDRSAMELYRGTVQTINPAFNAANALPQTLIINYTNTSISSMGGPAVTPIYNATTTYQPGMVVRDATGPGPGGGNRGTFICILPNTINVRPATGTLNWQPVIQPGMLLEIGGTEIVAVKTPPAWNAATPYAANQFVLFNGAIYRSLAANTGQVPATSAQWDANSFQVDCMLPHPAGSTFVCRGNPGPQPVYNPHKDTNVVLHMSVIQ